MKIKDNGVSLNNEDPIDVFTSFHTWRGKRTDDEDDEDTTSEGTVSYAMPSDIALRLKNNPDYYHGPVKHYTKAEIAEYERNRNDKT